MTWVRVQFKALAIGVAERSIFIVTQLICYQICVLYNIVVQRVQKGIGLIVLKIKFQQAVSCFRLFWLECNIFRFC